MGQNTVLDVGLFRGDHFFHPESYEVVLRFVFPWESYEWFVVPKVPLPLFLVILCSIFLGVLIGGVGDIYQRFQLKKTLRQNQKKMEALEREIQSLRGPGPGQSSSLNKEG